MDLPTEIMTNIISRLPIRTIISCKCVCKAWFELLNTRDFIKSHLSKSVPGLIVYQDDNYSDQLFRVFEFQDELELGRHELHYVPVSEFEPKVFITPGPDHPSIIIEGSANGLLFLRDIDPTLHALYMCNPITREYINIPNPKGNSRYPSVVTYGFGVSKITDQYKLVGIFPDPCVRDQEITWTGFPKSVCRVYTLGKESWRSVMLDSSHKYNWGDIAMFINGNLHWLVSDLKGSLLISCFDLETELFKAFTLPPYLHEVCRNNFGDVAVLMDCLCLCDNTSDYEIVIWIMKEYGVEKSWTKEFVISRLPDLVGHESYYEVFYPIKVFKDGDILLSWENILIFYYSNSTKTNSNVDMFKLQGSGRVLARLHVSSFLSLKSFATENVAKF